MSQQKQGVSSFLQNELERLQDDDEPTKEEDGGLGSFLESQLVEEDTTVYEPNDDWTPQVYFHSSEDMRELEDESVHFAITSPPYNTGWDYGDYDDNLNYATEYLPMLARVFTEVHRVLVPGGRFCVNVPSLLRSGASGGYPIAADITRMMLDDEIKLVLGADNSDEIRSYEDETPYTAFRRLRQDTDWVIREQIAWVKGFNDDGLAPNGSFPRPWGVLLNNMHEVIVVFQKPGKRTYEDMDQEIIERSKINKRDDDMCDDVWFISPESWSPQYIEGQDIPVFPPKLVRRAMRLWSYENDVVLDPFAGRFTTGKVAKEERRHGVGYELREELEMDIDEYVGTYQQGLYQYE